MTTIEETKPNHLEICDTLLTEFTYIKLRLSDLKIERRLTKFEEILIGRTDDIIKWAYENLQTSDSVL